MNKAIRLAVTMENPAGIGPEIVTKAAFQRREEVSAGRIEFVALGGAPALLLTLPPRVLPMRTAWLTQSSTP